jgi:hypothetical protein
MNLQSTREDLWPLFPWGDYRQLRCDQRCGGTAPDLIKQFETGLFTRSRCSAPFIAVLSCLSPYDMAEDDISRSQHRRALMVFHAEIACDMLRPREFASICRLLIMCVAGKVRRLLGIPGRHSVLYVNQVHFLGRTPATFSQWQHTPSASSAMSRNMRRSAAEMHCAAVIISSTSKQRRHGRHRVQSREWCGS